MRDVWAAWAVSTVCGQPEPHPAEEVGRDLLIPLRADDEVYVRRPPRMPRAVLEQLACHHRKSFVRRGKIPVENLSKISEIV